MSDKKIHNRDKHPEIWNAKEKAEKELSGLMNKRKVHTDKMTPIRAEIIERQTEVNILNDLAMVDAPRIVELRGEISRFARSMGAVEAGKK